MYMVWTKDIYSNNKQKIRILFTVKEAYDEKNNNSIKEKIKIQNTF